MGVRLQLILVIVVCKVLESAVRYTY